MKPTLILWILITQKTILLTTRPGFQSLAYKMCKIICGFDPLIILAKSYIFDVWQDSEVSKNASSISLGIAITVTVGCTIHTKMTLSLMVRYLSYRSLRLILLINFIKAFHLNWPLIYKNDLWRDHREWFAWKWNHLKKFKLLQDSENVAQTSKFLWRDIAALIELHTYNSSYIHITRDVCL